jgi:hypothetical protein
LLAEDIERRRWKNAGREVDMLADRSGVGEQSVERYERCERRKDGEQSEEYDATGNREQAVLVDLLVGAPGDVFPADEGNVERIGGIPSAFILQCPPEIDVGWLALGLFSEGSCRL